MKRIRTRRRLALAAALLAVRTAGAEPPPEDRCPSLSGIAGAAVATDAVPTPIREGMVLDEAGVLRLRDLVPEEVWRHRDAFFHPGMRMELGPCHRRYPRPDFYEQATRDFAERVRLDDEGNLRGYEAGAPFPPERMPEGDPGNGLRWAWNLAYRWRGSGPVGRFRIADMPAALGSVQTYVGSFFFLQTRHRADLRASDFALPESDESLFIAGGRFDEPFDARHLAWRQFRPSEAETSYRESDDIFVYVPTMRKIRRASTTWVDGMYTPRYRVSGDDGGGGILVPSGGGGGGVDTGYGVPAYDGQLGELNGVYPTASKAYPTTEHLRRGFTGMTLRPNAYVWRVAQEREVLAPLNTTRPGYPLDPERNFGTSGLSLGSDRWEVRWAVVLQGQPRERGGEFDSLTVYVDYQTLQPLYVITKRGRGRLVDVGILAHRFSGDAAVYPPWPDGSKALVFDPVAAVFVSADGSGWRRESYDVLSVPADPAVQRRFLSSDFLVRGK